MIEAPLLKDDWNKWVDYGLEVGVSSEHVKQEKNESITKTEKSFYFIAYTMDPSYLLDDCRQTHKIFSSFCPSNPGDLKNDTNVW